MEEDRMDVNEESLMGKARVAQLKPVMTKSNDMSMLLECGRIIADGKTIDERVLETALGVGAKSGSASIEISTQLSLSDNLDYFLHGSSSKHATTQSTSARAVGTAIVKTTQSKSVIGETDFFPTAEDALALLNSELFEHISDVDSLVKQAAGIDFSSIDLTFFENDDFVDNQSEFVNEQKDVANNSQSKTSDFLIERKEKKLTHDSTKTVTPSEGGNASNKENFPVSKTNDIHNSFPPIPSVVTSFGKTTNFDWTIHRSDQKETIELRKTSIERDATINLRSDETSNVGSISDCKSSGPAIIHQTQVEREKPIESGKTSKATPIGSNSEIEVRKSLGERFDLPNLLDGEPISNDQSGTISDSVKINEPIATSDETIAIPETPPSLIDLAFALANVSGASDSTCDSSIDISSLSMKEIKKILKDSYSHIENDIEGGEFEVPIEEPNRSILSVEDVLELVKTSDPIKTAQNIEEANPVRTIKLNNGNNLKFIRTYQSLDSKWIGRQHCGSYLTIPEVKNLGVMLHPALDERSGKEIHVPIVVRQKTGSTVTINRNTFTVDHEKTEEVNRLIQEATVNKWRDRFERNRRKKRKWPSERQLVNNRKMMLLAKEKYSTFSNAKVAALQKRLRMIRCAANKLNKENVHGKENKPKKFIDDSTILIQGREEIAEIKTKHAENGINVRNSLQNNFDLVEMPESGTDGFIIEQVNIEASTPCHNVVDLMSEEVVLVPVRIIHPFTQTTGGFDSTKEIVDDNNGEQVPFQDTQNVTTNDDTAIGDLRKPTEIEKILKESGTERVSPPEDTQTECFENDHIAKGCASENLNTDSGTEEVQESDHPPKSLYRCNDCNESFRTQSTLIRHKKNHTTNVEQLEVANNIKKYKCRWCRRTFTEEDHLNQHSAVHSRKKTYKCKICTKSFSNADHLKQHEKFHLFDEEACKKYTKKFKAFSYLQSYEEFHAVGKNSTDDDDDDDDDDVENSTEAEISMKIVSNGKESDEEENNFLKKDQRLVFRCKICQQRFETPSNLRSHKAQHHGKCRHCGEEFENPRDVHSHRCHSDSLTLENT